MSFAVPQRILLVSTPVGPLGFGAGGGVELTLRHLALGLQALGHRVTVFAPQGSVLPGVPLREVAGELHALAPTAGRLAQCPVPARSVLAAMWQQAARAADGFEVVVNLAYDALPFEVPLPVPVAHLVSMGSLSDTMDALITRAAQIHPGSVAVHSKAQARTFGPAGEAFAVLGNGLDLAEYAFCPTHDGALAFVGRIAPEKGLEDALQVAVQTGRPLRVWGLMQDEAYWQKSCAACPGAQVSYRGFVPTGQLQAGLGKCEALLMTPKWEEAFGNVAMEALACGVPVIAYDRGGPAEIVTHGATGFVVPADDVAQMAQAVGNLRLIDRQACRLRAEREYAVEAFARRAEQWLRGAVEP